MKLNLGKRLMLFVYWLASLVVLAMLVIPQYTNIALSYVVDLIPSDYMLYVVIALLAVYLLLSDHKKSRRADRAGHRTKADAH